MLLRWYEVLVCASKMLGYVSMCYDVLVSVSKVLGCVRMC